MARLSEHGIRLSSMSPSFLNSNSTSHTWPFSAVAELIDNASDPGVTAKQVWVDVVQEEGQLCLTFTDNGSGMTPNKLHKMLSFGFTGKGTGPASLTAIGVYGNGFKSGSMRLGRDALIFTKNGGCQSVGMLSQTYLDNIRAQAVIVPIAPFSQQTKSLVVTEDSEASLKAILTHSLITSQDQLHAHFDSIPSKKGTKILIWNIRRTKDGKPELDFESDVHDIRMPEVIIEELKRGRSSTGNLKPDQNLPNIDFSLRAYLSILYLKPRTQVILRQKKVLAKLVAKNLGHIENDVYKPQFSKEKVKVTFGMNKNKDHYGIMLYHKNRLIKSYEKVGCQIKASGQRGGVGVIGVMECNFLKPAHNKQDFEYTKEYRLTLGALGLKLNDYWREVMDKRAREREVQALEKRNLDMVNQEDNEESPSWLQCEECLKWRRVPSGHYHVSPEHWNCSQNPNPRFRSCSIPEETDESELLTPSYQKSYHKKQEQKTRKREKSLEGQPKTKPQVFRVLSAPPAPYASHTAVGNDTLTPDQTRMDACSEYQATHDGNDVHTQQILTSVITHTELLHTLKATLTQDQTHIETEQHIRGQTYTQLKRAPNHTPKDAGRILAQKEGDKDILSHKRKPTWPPNGLEKKARSGEQQSVPEAVAEELHPVKEANQPQRLSQDNSRQRAPSGADTAQNKSSITSPQCSASTQTMVVSLLSHQPVPPEGGDREILAQRLAVVEKEAKKLRKLLGIQVKTTSQGTMTTDAMKPPRGAETPTVSTATRLDGCRAESESSTGQAPGLTQGPEAVSGQKESSEQGRGKKEKIDSQSRLRAGDTTTNMAANITLVQEKLHGIRSNVVSLLSALLPQVDLAGVSVDSSDVDNILQQIIEVNSL